MRRAKSEGFVRVFFKVRGGASMLHLYAPESEALKYARDLADWASAEFISLGSWSWYGYDCAYYANEGIGCGRLGLPQN